MKYRISRIRYIKSFVDFAYKLSFMHVADKSQFMSTACVLNLHISIFYVWLNYNGYDGLEGVQAHHKISNN